MKLACASRAALSVAAVACLLASCAASGPELPANGSYRLLASSSEGSVPSVPGSRRATLEVRWPSVRVEAADAVTSLERGPMADSAVLCPPRGQGRPVELVGGPVTVAGTTLGRPAMFGDCGVTRPVRVTLVDLDAASMTTAFGFARWVAFCDTEDPDC